MKIKTERMWDLETKETSNQCVDIYEHHRDSECEPPRIVIPHEAIDKVILALLKAKIKFDKEVNE